MSVLLLVPLVYLVVTLARIQAGAFGAEFAAREAARGAVVAGVAALEGGATQGQALAAAEQRGDEVAALAAQDFGFTDRRSTTVAFGCEPAACLAPGTDVVATVTIEVALPGVPGFVNSWMPLHVTVESSSASAVDGFASGS